MKIHDLSTQKGRNEYAESDEERKERLQNVIKVFHIKISASEFGNLSKIYKKFSKGNRLIEIETIEFEDTIDQHVTFLITDKIISSESNLINKVKEFISVNGLYGESFDVYELRNGKKYPILDEDDIK